MIRQTANNTFYSLSVLAGMCGLDCLGQRGPEIVGKYTLVMQKPPTRVPSGTVVDGPILGNGDLGVAIGGGPEDQEFYFGKNDFWSQQASVMSVGSLRLRVPELSGASYREEQSLADAQVVGTFSRPGSVVRMRSWVAAGKNVVVTSVSAEGAAITVNAQLSPRPAAIQNNRRPVNLGREQHGDGRWYFDGLLDEVQIFNQALEPDAIKDLAQLREVKEGLVRHWAFENLNGPSATDTPLKVVSGADCGLPPRVFRPAEEPTEEQTGCRPDGYHLDYQRFSLGKIGRAAKLMHSAVYLDAGQIPALQQVTLAAWIYIFAAGDANYIVSKGEWNEAYSLALDHGKLRLNIGDHFARTAFALPIGQWVHVAGTFDGSSIRLYVDGKEALPRARFLSGGSTSDTVWISRNADGPVDEQYEWPNPLPPTRTDTTQGREITIAAHLIGAKATVQDGALQFVVRPGAPVSLVTAVLTDLDAPDHRAAAIAMAEGFASAGIEALAVEHHAWWRRYWSESSVEINDPLLEKFYYSSQYVIASSSRSGKVAPGLYGPWVTTDHPSWNGDYTTNYNHQTPFLALYASNHIATTDPYDPPIMAFLERGKLYAQTMLHVRGAYYPGHLGPWGLERPFDYEPFMGEKGDAAFLVQPMLMRFYSTYDLSYGERVYPFILAVGDFWEDYLRRERDRYVIDNDCPGEVGPWALGAGANADWTACGSDRNPLNDLAFVKATFRGLIAMSTELGRDADRRSKWTEIVAHLSTYPTQELNGKTVFRASETGPGGGGGGMRAVWPTGEIGLGSDPQLLATARNSADQIPFDGHPLLPPALARIGYDPNKLLESLRTDVARNGYANGYIFFHGGGVETASMIPGAINEMLLQSSDGMLRLFPDWPKDHNARFDHLRAYGAFLVSAEISDGKVMGLVIDSEKGRLCTIQNPWPGKRIRLSRNGHQAETLDGEKVVFGTGAGEKIVLAAE